MMRNSKSNLMIKMVISLVIIFFSTLIPNYGHTYYGGLSGGRGIIYGMGGLYGMMGGMYGMYGGMYGMMGGMYGMYGGMYGMMGGMYGGLGLYGLGGYSDDWSSIMGQMASYPAYARPYVWGVQGLSSSSFPAYSGWQGVYGPGVSFYE
jgi:hypothetical protein